MKVIPVAHNALRIELEDSSLILTIRDSTMGYVDITEGIVDGWGEKPEVKAELGGSPHAHACEAFSVRLTFCSTSCLGIKSVLN